MYMAPEGVLVVLFEKSGVGVGLDRPKVAYPGIGTVVFELFTAEAGIKKLMLACPGTDDAAGGLYVAFIGRFDSADQTLLVIFVGVDDNDVIVPLVFMERVAATEVAVPRNVLTAGVMEELGKELVGPPKDVGAL